jgi:hypothetical protein
MPPAIIAVGAAVAGSAAAAAVGGGLIGALVGATVTVGVSYLGSRIIGTPKPDQAMLDAGTGRSQMLVQPVTSHRIVYGEVRAGGPLVFAHTRTDGGSRLDMLHLVVVHAAHEVESLGEVWFGDTVIALDGNGAATGAPWVGKVNVWSHLGQPDQGVDAILVAESGGRWTQNHRLRGRAYTHLRLRYDETAFTGGIPKLSRLVRGRKLWDPRDGATRWSANAALCVLDYLMAPWGLAAGSDEVDLDGWIAQANICDEPAATLTGTEPRYTCNGVLDLAGRPLDNLESLLTSCAGRLSFTGGKWRLAVGAWQPPTVILGENELRAPVTYRPWRSRRSLVNTVRGAFTSPADNWQPTDYPPVSDATAVVADDGEVALTLDLPFTTSHTQAQRIARIALRQNRRQKSLDWPANLAGLRVAAGHPVAVSLGRLGQAATPFRVETWRMSGEMGVDLALAEDAADVYAHDPSWLKAM